MPQNLLDQSVESTYEGVLHAEGAALPLQGTQIIYDGSGQASSLEVGVSGNGIAIAGGLSITGKLSTGALEFTNVDAASGEGFPLVTDGAGNVDFGQIVLDALPDLDPNPEGSYAQIDSININNKGLVEQVFLSPIRQCWVNFDGVPITNVAYTVNTGVSGGVVDCQKVAHGLANGQIISLTATDVTINGAYPVTVTDSNNFTFPLPKDYASASGTLGINTTIRSAYNVAKVTRLAAGKYNVRFNDTFNNNMYMVQATKGWHTNPAANPASPATGNNGWVVVLEQGSQEVVVYSQNGDCNNMNILAIGNTLVYSIDKPQMFYTNYNYRDYYYLAEKGERGSCSINTGTISYTITPEYMAQNKLIAVEVSIYGYDRCREGSYTLNATNVVTDTDDVVYTSTFSRATSTGGKPSAIDRVTTIIVYIDNTLYYKNFFTGLTTVSTSTAVDIRTTDANAVPRIDAANIAYCKKNLSGTKTTNSYITDLLTKYGFQPSSANGFRAIKSATITNSLRAAHTGDCEGGIATYRYIKEFFITQVE